MAECKFCTPDGYLLSDVRSLENVVEKNKVSSLSVRLEANEEGLLIDIDHENTESLTHVHIQYCPMCGRKLEVI